MINDTIGPNQPLMLELLLLQQSLKNRWGCCPPTPAGPLGLVCGFTGQTVGTWLTKEGPKERDTLSTPHTKVLWGLGWGLFGVCVLLGFFPSKTSISLFSCPGPSKKLLQLKFAVQWHYFWWYFGDFYFAWFSFLYVFSVFCWLKKWGLELCWTAFGKFHLKLLGSSVSKWKVKSKESNREENREHCWGLLEVCVTCGLGQVQEYRK